MFQHRFALCTLIATMGIGIGADWAAGAPVDGKAEVYTDPVPHQLITQPYRVCQDLDELTARINNLYRKPLLKVLDHQTGVMQPETVYFKDTVSGHEIMSLTRGLCQDISHPDLGRPVWTCDGRHILFEGNRGFFNEGGKLIKENWPGHKYIMSADYTDQRALMVRYLTPFRRGTGIVSRSAGIAGKFNIMDPVNPKLAYYAEANLVWRVTLDPQGDSVAEQICTLSNDRPKIIQDVSREGKLLIQDVNTRADKDGKLLYMPEIHLINLKLKPGESGFYSHHPMDYGLPEVKDDKGKIVHAADNNHWVHSITFGKLPNTIEWNYGPMTDVGEPLNWTLDISHGLDGVPTHGAVTAGSSKNKWDQYESHGQMIGSSTYGLYFAGPPKEPDGKKMPGGPYGWGVYVRDFSNPDALPRFIMPGPGGHIAGGNSTNPDVWAAYMSTGWKIPTADTLVWGHVTGPGNVLCYTFSRVRGAIRSIHGKPVSWNGIDDNGPRPYSCIPRPLLSPDGTKLWFHSSMLQPEEDYVGAYVVVISRPAPPEKLHLAEGAKDVQLQWQPAPVSAETKGYHVYRGNAAGTDFVELTTTAIPEISFTDSTAKSGSTYTYAVTAEEWSTLESDQTSNVLKATVTGDGVTAQSQPGIKGWDKTAPVPVEAFKVAAETDAQGQYRLSWAKDAATDVRHYNVYFSSKGRPDINQKCLLVSPPAERTGYLDWSAPIGTDVHYAITAVDRQGNESAPTYAQLKR
jgi:hypothetical protein